MASSVNFFFQGDFEKPQCHQISLTYQSYIEPLFLVPLFTSKPIMITLDALKLTLAISFCSLLFLLVVLLRKVTKAKVEALALHFG